MADRDCAICRGTGKYPVSVDITGKLADCPDCTPEPTNLMRAALVAIQELHVPYVTNGGSEICMRCGLKYPCATRKLADEGLAGEERG